LNLKVESKYFPWIALQPNRWQVLHTSWTFHLRFQSFHNTAGQLWWIVGVKPPSHGSFDFSQGTCVGLLGELDEEQELLREKEYLITPCPPQPNTEAPCSIELHTLNKHRAPL
jgi:hypothetical protein